MIVLTGGAGFMGRTVALSLLGQGRAVRVLDVQPWSDRPPEIELIEGSVDNPTALQLAVRGGVEGVIHLGAISSLWTRDKEAHQRINAHGAGLAAQIAKREGVGRFVYVSSHTTLISGPPKQPPVLLDEQVHVPSSALLGSYPRSKREGERAVLALNGPEFAAISAIPTLPIGPGDVSRTAPTRLLLDLARGRLPALLETSMNFIDVRDLARALIAALDRGRGGERYLLSGHDLRLSEVAAQVAKAARRGRVLARVSYPLALSAAHVQEALAAWSGKPPEAPVAGVKLAGRWVEFSNAKARDALGLQVRPFADSLADFLEWARQERVLKRR
jgi:dihydroflavonol-4-reductase